MQGALLDTSIYVASLRSGDASSIGSRGLAPGVPLWLSAVVLEELYAGAGRVERRALEQLQRDFDRAKRIVAPSLEDWAETGRLLNRLAAKYHYEQIGRGRLTNDALIAISAGRLGIRVVTANEGDFGRLAEFWPFQWQLSNMP